MGSHFQLSMDVFNTQRKWSLLKADHADAYNQLPLDQGYANLTLVALSNPYSGKWFAFIPKVLSFGAVSEVIHYNCFSRLFAVLMNLTLRIPVLNYFNDFGAVAPSDLGREALSVCERFSAFPDHPMEKIKSDVKNQIKFLGLLWSFPEPGFDGLPSRGGKIIRRPQITLDRATTGRICHKGLEKLIGKLSFTHTPVFGRFGRTILNPLRGNLMERPFSEQLSDGERDILMWWAQSIRETVPRIVQIKHDRPEYVIYTDASTSAGVVASLSINVEGFSHSPSFEILRVEVSEPEWGIPSYTLLTFTSQKCSQS